VLQESVSNKWPGNIRELEHTIERIMLLTNGKIITNLHLFKPITSETIHIVVDEFHPKSLADNERELIMKTLKYTNGRIWGENGAAMLLHILPSTLKARMKKLE
jgi:DNA-binding NtrC family response regulator